MHDVFAVEALLLLKYPMGHNRQDCAPVTLAKEPGGQVVHATAPEDGANDPVGQSWQLDCPVELPKEPARQAAH